MTRFWMLAPVAVLVGLPVAVLPARPIVWVAAAAGLVCLGGVVARSTALVGAGGGIALLAYAIALWIAAPAPDVAGAIIFGLALFLLLEGSHLAGPLGGAALSRAVVRRRLARWGVVAALSVAGAALLDGLAARALFAAPAWVHAVVLAAGALGVMAGVLQLLPGRSHAPRSPRGAERGSGATI